ncbi:MAG: Acyltransferase [uncultured Acidimicrobiales bacterium]|uniref:Acyltransferase n=1 Tax=uncultured Acidimicrobiales bacterium TaxID=310071 RepID=A0A6J4HXG1_9ACTN|nr:MAG: Acyltransferase [uncultured Acidimicrobiales bacterium]
MATLTTSPPHASTGALRIPQLPALDGLRAVAVVAVLLWHAEVGVVRGGFLGVESFFVISGYLITALLWTERRATGRTSLLGFWTRRARRLLPAVYLLLLVVMAALVVGWRDLVARARGDAAAAAVYVSNWYQLLSNQSYFAESGRPSPFKHLWSLAVEEQFYVAWPLLLLGLVLLWRGDRVRIAVTVAALAAASGSAMAIAFSVRHDPGAPVPYDPSRLYYGLDTRAGGLLLGCALALVWRPWERSEADGKDEVRAPTGRAWPSWYGGGLGLTGLVILLLCFWRLSDHQPFVYLGGLQLVAVATALAIVGTTGKASLLTRVLGARPLVALGRRSYSLYLWHWPVYVVTRPGLDVPWTSGPTLVLRLALSCALAELSYRFVEVPVRQGALSRSVRRVRANLRLASPQRRRQVRRSWSGLGAGALCILIVLGVAMVRAEPPRPLESLLSTGGPPAPPGEEAGRAIDPLVPVAAGPADASGPADTATTPSTNPAPPGADPTANAAGSSGATGGPATSVVPTRAYAIGDSVMLGAQPILTETIPGIVVNAKLGRYMGEAGALVSFLTSKEPSPESIVVHLGSNGPADRSEVVDIIKAAGGRRVVFVTVKVPRRWEGASNSAITQGVAGQPNVRVVDWKRASGGCAGGAIFYDDGIHLKPAGASCYAQLIRAALA